MANIKSQKKRILQSERARERNKAVRTSLKTAVKRVRTATTDDPAAAQEQLRETMRALDKAASKGIIHRRTAARRKSRLAKVAAPGPSGGTGEGVSRTG